MRCTCTCTCSKSRYEPKTNVIVAVTPTYVFVVEAPDDVGEVVVAGDDGDLEGVLIRLVQHGAVSAAEQQHACARLLSPNSNTYPVHVRHMTHHVTHHSAHNTRQARIRVCSHAKRTADAN